MYFSRITSIFAVAATFCTLASANPVPSVEKRQDISSIEGVLDTLQSSTNSILPQISALGSGGNATSANLSPLINDLDSALKTAASSLNSLGTSSRVKRQTENDVASLVAGIITNIANALGSIEGGAAAIPGLDNIDADLTQVLDGLETLLAGVLNLVADLLTDVSGLLRQLALGLTLGSLGI